MVCKIIGINLIDGEKFKGAGLWLGYPVKRANAFGYDVCESMKYISKNSRNYETLSEYQPSELIWKDVEIEFTPDGKIYNISIT
ncbi:MAG: hypothetical protein ACI4KH_08945 [Oscillospiraceae bacterium]